MILQGEETAAVQLLCGLSEVEGIQRWKIMILRTIAACGESADAMGKYVDVLIEEFRRGRPTAVDIDELGLLNKEQSSVKIAIIKIQVELEGVYRTVEDWMRQEHAEKERRKEKMKSVMDKALETAALAKRMHERGEKLEELVKMWAGTR